MSAFHDNALIGASGSQGYQISRSVRLRSSASAYFNRTPASAGNRRTFTLSGWVKRGSLGATQWLFDADNGSTDSTEFNFAFTSSDTLTVSGSLTTWRTTTQVFRDPSAWYHIILSVDTTQATANNRIRLYVNGSEITAFGTLNNPTQNLDLGVNQAIAHYIGIRTGLTSPLNGYLTEVNFIDGQALTPSSFGETDTITGVWKPKKYTGTYGTNGFYLNFSDNSSNTATTIGKDYSGNGNNWTPNNISVTAGVTYDSMLDVPTQWADGGNGRGNYAVLNPLQSGSYVTQSNGNLTNTGNTATNSALVLATIGELTSGKWYWEYTQGTVGSETCGVVTTYTPGTSLINGENIGAFGVGARASGTVYGGTVGSITSWTTGDVIGLALDCDNGAIYWSKNGTWLNSGVPTSGASKTGAVGTWTPSAAKVTPAFGAYNGGSVSATFGQRPFSYTPPSGFKALNTLNLPTPTILKGNQYFDVSLYTGNATARSITGVGFQPDFVWAKSRSGAESHRLYDAVRGATQSLYSNLTNAETTEAQSLTAFNSDGFSLGTGAPNSNAVTYAAWQWKEGATQGFDIVLYTGNSTNRTIAHNLGVAPRMIILKSRTSGTAQWVVYHGSLSNTQALYLNATSSAATSALFWNSTSPTSSVFSLGTSSDVNVTAQDYVAYLFAEVAGFSKFGSISANGSADNAFVFTGFLPRLVMLKRTDSTSNWIIWDTARNTYNVLGAELYPNLSNAESTVTDLDLLSNGFKLRNSSFTGTWIYAAFATVPFKTSLAR